MHATEEHPPRVELFDYPVPDGIVVPNLMPYQLRAWNGDGYLAAEVLRLKEAHGLKIAFETGTCLGSTTLWLNEHFPRPHTAETNAAFFAIAEARFNRTSGPFAHLCESVKMLADWLPTAGDRPAFIFLDAHWNNHCPLLDELDAIATAGVKPVIAIHDMMVPGHPELGFDKMPDGTPFTFELVRPYMDRIYGVGKYSHHFNSEAAGAMRGVLYIEPQS